MSLVKVKICGITNEADAMVAAECGADYIGFIFIEGTPRCISARDAEKIIKSVSERFENKTEAVGLFKDASVPNVVEIINQCGLGYVQLHGGEDPAYCDELKKVLLKKHGLDVKIIKAFRVSPEGIVKIGKFSPADYKSADFLVFDTFHPKAAGGTGEKFDWNILKQGQVTLPFFVAGGLNPGNVADAVKILRPYGVDASSGIEKKTGKKNKLLMKEFVQNAKNA